MKLITAHDLRTGEVVYLAPAGAWTSDLDAAARLNDDEAALAVKAVDATRVVNAYLVEADADGALAQRVRLRESIRAAGPTVRLDLGKQASNP
ncbi:MAG: DUF2849 domain-containing protein [Alphaproteobacteria bacterium]|nr:DUF2849 domain-containing protein [Alphaproteobacteria bacterium]